MSYISSDNSKEYNLDYCNVIYGCQVQALIFACAGMPRLPEAGDGWRERQTCASSNLTGK
jgi:hypothetical protein